MKTKTTLGTLLATLILLGLTAPLAKADTLDRTDFAQESFSKTVDYMEYVRAYATLHGIPQPANFDKWHASTFLMLMAFNETATSLYPDSPDRNDMLYASFSLGFDLSDLGETLPVLNSKTETIPLTHKGNQWTWGMKYTNLTALWWRTWIDPNNPRFQNSWPLALTIYDELTFTYKLTIDPEAGTATLQENQ